jgi:hypothetical protein
MPGRPGPLTTHELDQLRAGHTAGKSLTAIAAEMGRSKGTLAKHAKRMGLDWNRDATAKATEAKTQDNRSKRATLESRLLDEAGLLLDDLHKPHLAYNFGGKDNTYAEHQLPEPDIAGKRALITAAGQAIDRALKLAEVDRASTGAVAGKSLVGSLFLALQTAGPGADESPAAQSDGAED